MTQPWLKFDHCEKLNPNICKLRNSHEAVGNISLEYKLNSVHQRYSHRKRLIYGRTIGPDRISGQGGSRNKIRKFGPHPGPDLRSGPIIGP